MKTQFSALVTATLLLGACAPDDQTLDMLEPSSDAEEGAAPAQQLPGGLGGQEAPQSETLNIDGIDECYALRAPVIAFVDHTTVVDCQFAGLPQDWSATPLVAASPWLAGALANAPLPETSPLLDFCKYEYEGPEEDIEVAYANLFESAVGSPGVDDESMATDCPVITQQAGLDTSALRTATQVSFAEGVGSIEPLDLANLHGNRSHLYLLDTAQQGMSAREPHSDMLRGLITDLVCGHDPSHCEDLIHQVLVTPRNLAETSYEADWNTGGTNGYVHELNLGIVTAVQDWIHRNEDQDPNTLERGVINLSVGAPDLGLYATDPNYAPMRSLIEATRLAACYGMPIYAAAGNTSASERYCPGFDDGLMIPASLEQENAPLMGQCADWGYLPNWNTGMFPIDGSAGLVTAVSGVDHLDVPIVNHRDQANTRAAAPAALALSSEGGPIMTGTSVASAVYAATAQLMWAAEPLPPAAELSAGLYQSGFDMAAPADAGRYVGHTRRRLSMCASVDAFSGGGLDCEAAPPNPAALDGFTNAISAAIATAPQVLSANHVVINEAQDPAAPLACSATVLAELTEPLPEKPVCSSCSGQVSGATNPNNTNGDEALFMSITTEESVEGHTVINAYLHVYDSSGLLETISLSPAVVTEINAADPTYIIEVNFDQPSMSSAELEFIYQNDITGKKKSHSNPLTML